MFDFEVFKEVVAEQIKEHLPEEYANASVELNQVEKVNENLDSIIIRQSEGQGIAPSVYLNPFYEEYKNGKPLEEVIQKIAETHLTSMKKAPTEFDHDFRDMEGHVFLDLVNTEQNREMLENCPHKEFNDLSVIFRYLVNQDEKGIYSCRVSNRMMEMSGATPEQLFQWASKNTEEFFPSSVITMTDLLREAFAKDGVPPREIDMLLSDVEPDKMMWVITNETRINGAAAMLYDKNLQKVAQKLQSDLYIMPSSRHEVIAVSVKMGEPDELARMVSEINMSQVDLKDRLSNNVYHYDKDLRQVTLATDVPDKRLDGMLAEAPLVYENEDKTRR